MTIELWYLFIGGLFVLVTIIGSATRRLPMTLTMLYLVAGLLLGPMAFGAAAIPAIADAALLEHLSELAVIVSLFTAGLKLRCPLPDARWAVPLRLAFGSMVLTVGLVAVFLAGNGLGCH